MDNHAHLLLREASPGDIIMAMRKLITPYAFWFNRKYLRNGALIANRYWSECVESEEYLLALVRYIHQNPVVAKAAEDMESYRFSSYCDYLKVREGLCDVRFILNMFSGDLDEAAKDLASFHLISQEKGLI